jgi:hypothetical protein
MKAHVRPADKILPAPAGGGEPGSARRGLMTAKKPIEQLSSKERRRSGSHEAQSKRA